MTKQTDLAAANSVHSTQNEPAVFVLSEMSWGDDAHGENLPVAALVRFTKTTVDKVDQAAVLIQNGTTGKQGTYLALAANDVAWLGKVRFGPENSLSPVLGFYSPDTDALIYLSDAADMEMDGDRVDYGPACEIFEFKDESDQEASSLLLRDHRGEGLGVCVVGSANDFPSGGFFESWPHLREQIRAELEKRNQFIDLCS